MHTGMDHLYIKGTCLYASSQRVNNMNINYKLKLVTTFLDPSHHIPNFSLSSEALETLFESLLLSVGARSQQLLFVYLLALTLP